MFCAKVTKFQKFLEKLKKTLDFLAKIVYNNIVRYRERKLLKTREELKTMKTLRQIQNRIDKMDLDKEFIINMNDYFRFIKNHNDKIKARLIKRLKKADLTIEEFTIWMQTDNR